jgi:putative transposase
MPTRKAPRLSRFDYDAPGAYFVTICVAGKECVLGSVQGGRVLLNTLGAVVARGLADVPTRRAAHVDSSFVMPNHVHAVIWLRGNGTSLGQVVGAFKAASAREINRLRGVAGIPFWQRGYFDHVVRDDNDLERVREYIATNPIRWSAGKA